MANFFLIDHSLQQPGGHHADYARCVAEAAIDMGFKTTIGTHSRLGRCDSIDQLGEVRRVFRQTTYQKDSYLAGLRHLTRAKTNFLRYDSKKRSLANLTRFLRERRHRNRRETFIRGFAKDCQRFFGSSLFSNGDHAFFTTVSELELMGLAAFLSNHPRSLQLHWHLQFHFNLFDGRTPEYDEQQDVALAIQSCFDAALARIPYHSLHFYTTSETLADQYNRLQVGTFDVLPYPVSPAFGKVFADPVGDSKSQSIKMQPDRPLRLTCPGGIRREKGHLDYLQPLVDQIWTTHIATGKVKIAVQRSAKSKLELNQPIEASLAEAPVEYLAHPLTDQAYIEFIKSADCGLLFYDSRAYFSRRAGVLGELLSCGKPVIVPSGSWLSEQLQRPIFQHVRRLVTQDNLVRKLDTHELKFDSNNVPLPGGVVSFDQFRHPFEMTFEPAQGETGMVLSFDWHWPDAPGVFARIEVEQNDARGNLICAACQVVGHRREFADSAAFFRLLPETHKVGIRFRNAFHDSNASVKNVQIATLSLNPDDTPVGAVGIVAADQNDLPNCIDELVKHYHHYRTTAEEFAYSWSKQHQPRRTVAHLISTEEQSLRAA